MEKWKKILRCNLKIGEYMKRLGFILLTATLAVGTLAAVETRVPRNPMADKQQINLYSKMAKLAEKNKRFAGGKNAPESRLEADLAERGCGYYGASYGIPLAPHFVREIDPIGAHVTIEDGSLWTVSMEDEWIVRNWYGRCELSIQPNSLSFWNKLTNTRPAYKYRLVNLYTGESVAANLSLGPLAFDPNTRQIATIDYYRGEIFLTNGQIWKVDLTGPCQEILNHWYAGNAVIAGTNDTWYSLGNPHILICVEDDNWLPAVRIY